jgi:hypothetical protein
MYDRLINSIESYITYNRNSTFRFWHSTEGRDRAQALLVDIRAATSVEDVITAIQNLCFRNQNLRHRPHSLFTYLVNSLHYIGDQIDNLERVGPNNLIMRDFIKYLNYPNNNLERVCYILKHSNYLNSSRFMQVRYGISRLTRQEYIDSLYPVHKHLESSLAVINRDITERQRTLYRFEDLRRNINTEYTNVYRQRDALEKDIAKHKKAHDMAHQLFDDNPENEMLQREFHGEVKELCKLNKQVAEKSDQLQKLQIKTDDVDLRWDKVYAGQEYLLAQKNHVQTSMENIEGHVRRI